MQHLVRNIILCVAVLVLAIWAIVPPEKKLRLGKDLRGGTSLIYAVNLKPTDPPDVMARVIETVKQRVDPFGQSDISIVQQGKDRLEITMPLPSERVKRLKADYEAELKRLAEASLDAAQFERLMRVPSAEREKQIQELSHGSAARAEQLRKAAAAHDKATQDREAMVAAQAELKAAKESGKDKAEIDRLQAKLDSLVAATADSELAYERARKDVMRAALPPSEVIRALSLSTESTPLRDGNKIITPPSPRERALTRLRTEHPEMRDQLERVLAAYERYAGQRTRLDDPADLKRLLSGAGVLDFRIAIKPGQHPEEPRLRQELRERGPRNVRSTDARWYKINKLDGWYDTPQELDQLQQQPGLYFGSRYQLVAEESEGEFYVLLWDTPGSRLTQAEGQWAVESGYQTTDEVGRPAIGFEMNARGATLLDELTRAHVGQQMAVLLDDQVYTAPNLRSAIGKRGQISGTFSDAELRYIVRVLSAGAMQAKLSQEPISENSLGPELGADNLKAGFTTGIIALTLVAAFMVFYYFQSGLIAVFALCYNFVLVLAIMSVMRSAFTMPGIAGVVLTFGQAVDSNVLIYERMREEFHRGADMRTAVRLGFSRAFSPIMDGNISNLIICAVLYFFGTQEIKGFAITLGIGVLTTLFSALVVSRLIFNVLVERFHWRKTSQLPMVFPRLQRLLTPHVDWMRPRWVLLGILVAFLLATGAVIVERGPRLLGTEFRGGTEVELQFKNDPKTGQPIKLSRHEVQERLGALGRAAVPGDDTRVLVEAEVLPINPDANGITSNRFRIQMGHANKDVILATIAHTFEDVMESRGAVTFTGLGADVRSAPVYRVMSRTLGANIDRPALQDDVGAYLGGVAIVLDNIQPPTSRESLLSRLEQMRQQPDYADTLARTRELRVVDGSDAAVKTAVLLVRDDTVSAFSDPQLWDRELGEREWRLVNDALTRTSQLASVQNFSAAIAATFTAQAIVSVTLSLLLLTIYVWVRFGAGRWAIAATVPLFADVIGIIGMLGVAQILYETPATNGFARAIGLLPFKLDLAQIAALLTIVGYSLNDKIIILDRIRENKGKLPYASYATVNGSINQTLSRTVITAGAHLITTVILYVFGGEAVRGFAFAFNLGVILGTYTSIVSSPLVWSHKSDPTYTPPGKARPPAPPPAVGVPV